VYRFVAYAFPFVLIIIEYGLRFALKTDTSGFVGPTLASAAAGMLVPTLALKTNTSQLTPEFQNELQRIGATIRSPKDERLIAFAVFALMSLIAAWVWTLILAEGRDTETIATISRPVFIGLACYFVGVVIAEVKELV
jgi:hypothetical protein